MASPTHAKPAAKPTAKTARPALYVVGYSHLDTQWCWSYPQVIREFIPNTLHENFALFKQYPDYVFNWTGSNRYRFMKQYYPADYAQLKKYVASGQWFPAGSSVEEGDVNSPSEESLVRQVMYGNEFFRKEFGKASEEYMLPDCFGFPASLPSILAHCGLNGFSTQKLTWGSAVGIPFNVGKWVGPDGHYVVCGFNPGAYDSDVDANLSSDPNWVSRLQKDEQKDGLAIDYKYYGVGDRGGAPNPPSVKLVQESLKGPGPTHIFQGRADQMFNDLTPEDKKKLPEYKGDLELTQHSAGSLTSEAAMKRWNRKNELLANETETASVAADLLGALPYDKSRITDAWLRFLPGQFHDLMAGTALPIAYTYTWNDEVIAMNEFSGVLRSSVGGAARALDTRGEGIPLTVYNPLSIARDDVVEATVQFPGAVPHDLTVFDQKGSPLPTQIVSRGEHSAKILFKAHIPSLGFAVFNVQAIAGSVMSEAALKVSETGLENSRYSVKIDSNGDVSSVFDKKIGKELLSAPARLAYQHENPTQYPSWNMDWSDQKQEPRAYVTGPVEVKVVENGPVRVALQITRRSEGSKFIQTLRLGTGDAADRLDFATKIDWQGKESALKAVFPLTASNPKATYNWGLGTVTRGNNDPKKYEVASHGWIDLTNSDNSYGASILDDCKYGSDKPSDNTIRLTLIYSPGVQAGYQHQATQDWGRNVMTYALMGHANSWETGNTQWSSAELNQPLLAFQTVPHKGVAGKEFSVGKTSDDNVSLEAVKQAEDGTDVVVRLNELAGAEHKGVKVHLMAPIVGAEEIDGQERPIGKADVENGQLVLDVHPYEPRAFKLKLGSSSWLSAPKSTSLSLPFDIVGISNGFGVCDGKFGNSGEMIPGDLVPSKIVSDGVEFKTGPKGSKNIMSSNGQTIKLPSGTHRKLYILGASAGNDLSLDLDFGTSSAKARLQSWSGAIGEWDTRLWGGKVPELTYDWHNPMIGLVPGFIKRESVAWYSDHTRTADGGNEPYKFCYLFKTSVEIPDGATEVKLPQNEDARIAAMTVSQNPNDDTVPAQPLYDVLEHANVDGPAITVSATQPNAEQIVTIEHPLYWSSDAQFHYTLDGTTPTAESPVYHRPFAVGKSGILTIARIGANGQAMEITKSNLEINDTAAPTLQTAVSLPTAKMVKLEFSGEVERASAETASNYTVGGTAATSAKLSEDGRTVSLELAADPASEATLAIHGVKDMGGVAVDVTGTVKALAPVYTQDAEQTFTGAGNGIRKPKVDNLPVAASAPWTINLFVNMAKAPEDLTMLAGFGSGSDTSGAQRYILANSGHLFFWGSNIDIDSGTGFDLNRWQMITATYDGKMIRLYKDGKELKSEEAMLADADNVVRLAPRPAWGNGHRFSGKLSGLTVWNECLSPNFISTLTAGTPH